ncbi:hypothetical protein V8E55_009527, partial [Tylopilus felleus]
FQNFMGGGDWVWDQANIISQQCQADDYDDAMFMPIVLGRDKNHLHRHRSTLYLSIDNLSNSAHWAH